VVDHAPAPTIAQLMCQSAWCALIQKYPLALTLHSSHEPPSESIQQLEIDAPAPPAVMPTNDGKFYNCGDGVFPEGNYYDNGDGGGCADEGEDENDVSDGDNDDNNEGDEGDNESDDDDDDNDDDDGEDDGDDNDDDDDDDDVNQEDDDDDQDDSNDADAVVEELEPPNLQPTSPMPQKERFHLNQDKHDCLLSDDNEMDNETDVPEDDEIEADPDDLDRDFYLDVVPTAEIELPCYHTTQPPPKLKYKSIDVLVHAKETAPKRRVLVVIDVCEEAPKDDHNIFDHKGVAFP
jgi:hypothetical protein